MQSRIVGAIAGILAGLIATAGTENTKETVMNIIPVNVGEQIIAPFFHDPAELRQWKVESGDGKMQFSPQEPGLSFRGKVRISRTADCDLSHSDRLLFALFLPPGTRLKVEASTDRGALVREYTAPNDNLMTTEYELPLNGAKRLYALAIELETSGKGNASLRFILAENQRLTTELDRFYRQLGEMDWSVYLRENHAPAFRPGLRIFGTEQDFERVRALVSRTPPLARQLEAESSKLKKQQPPEKRIRPYNTMIRRFVRDRDLKNGNLQVGPAAWYGMLAKDPELMSFAARGAIALAMTPHWGAGMYSSLPGTTVEHRCFDEVEIAEQLVFILDLCYDMFTETGRELILRGLAEKALGTINYTCWKWDYIYRCNQMGHFSGGRVAAYLAMEKSGWKHVSDYTELAIKDLNKSMKRLLQPDGGYLEGSHYFLFTFRSALPAYYMYAGARGKAPAEVVPPELFQSREFAELILSTDRTQGVIPINDGRSYMHATAAMLFAALMPETIYAAYANRYLEVYGYPPLSDYWCYLAGQAGEKRSEPSRRNFVKIDSIASAASLRELEGEPLKIAFLCDALPAAHRHRDAGNFLVEFAGETLLMDSGICDYADPMTRTLQGETRHNVAVPVMADGSLGQQNLSQKPLNLVAEGDSKRFRAQVDLTPVWKGKFRKRIRKLLSDTPDRLTVEDTFLPESGVTGTVVFLLSPFPFQVEGREVTISGQRGETVFQLPDGIEWKSEQLTRPKQPDQYRLTLDCGKATGLKLEFFFRKKQ